jgi:hypothetical protein
MKFRRKAKFIEAIQWDIQAIQEMTKAEVSRSDTAPEILYVGLMRVEIGEWVVKGDSRPWQDEALREEYDSVLM